MKPYVFKKIVIPGWEKVGQRAYLVLDRETQEPLGRVHDQRLWNLYDPEGDNWVTAHSNPELDGNYHSTRASAADELYKARARVEAGREFPSVNLEHAQNFNWIPEE